MTWRISPVGVAGLLVPLGVNVWLLAVATTAIVSDGPVPTHNVDWKFNLSEAIGHVAGRKPIEAYRQILARPIFFRSREPFVPAPVPPPPVVIATPPPTPVDPGFVLGGVMIKNDSRKAYVFSKASASGAWTAEGDEFMGWKISSINALGVKLEQKEHAIDLQLYPRE